MVKSSNHHDFLEELFFIPRTSGVVPLVEAAVSGEDDDEEDERKTSELWAIFERSKVKSFSIRPYESA